MRYFVSLGLLVLLAIAAYADVQLAPIFGDGMVLQQGMKVPVWGTAAPGEAVTLEFNGQKVTATADAQGAWKVELAPMAYGGPFPLTLTGNNTLELKTVYVGDVWVCSGQSNMEYPVMGTTGWQSVQKDKTPTLRLIKIFGSWEKPDYRASGHWEEASGNPMLFFSGPGYYFGKALSDARKVPLGLINNAVGATVIEQWTPQHLLKPTGIDNDGSMYREKMLPLLPLAIKGVLWYQGEFNVGGDATYAAKLRLLISSWRAAFRQPDLPFLIVQLPRNGVEDNPLPAPNRDSDWALLREAQEQALDVPHTGMALFPAESDGIIHPMNKRPLGERLALLARYMVYGEGPARNFCSPLFKSASYSKGQLLLRFTNAEDGLMAKDAPDGAIRDLFLIDQRGQVSPAKAVIKKDVIAVDLAGVQGVPDVYYDWRGYPMGNLYNAAGLPVAPFRLESLHLLPAECRENTLVLASNQSLDTKTAGDPAAYRITGKAVTKVEMLKDNRGVRLTVDKPWTPGEQVTVAFPRWKCWDGKTPLPALTFPVLPGRYATGDVLRECLLGDVRSPIDPKTYPQEPAPDVKALAPAEGPEWKLVRNDSEHYFNLLFQIPAPKSGDAVAIAHDYVYSDAERTVQLWFVADTFQRLFVNGVELPGGKPIWKPGVHDVVLPNVPLRKGWNTLALQVVRGNWSRYSVCIMNASGGPPEGISYQAAKPADFGR